MQIRFSLTKKMIVCLLSAALLASSLYCFPFGASAVYSPDGYHIYDMDFESDAYSDGDYMHMTTNEQYVHSGSKAGCLVNQGNETAPNPTTAILMKKSDGTAISTKVGYTYYIGFYYKVADDFPGATFRVDMGDQNISTHVNTLVTANVTCIKAPEKGKWCYAYLAWNNTRTTADYYLSVFLCKYAGTVYIDDVTIIEFPTGSDYGVLRLDHNNGDNYSYTVCGLGSEMGSYLPDTIDGGSEYCNFTGWYTTAEATVLVPSARIVSTTNTMTTGGNPTNMEPRTVYAGWAETARITKLGFESSQYGTDINYMHSTAQAGAFRNGASAGVLSGASSTLSADNILQLYDDSDVAVKAKTGYSYVVGFYYKGAEGCTGKASIDLVGGKTSDTWLTWNSESRINISTTEWQYGYVVYSVTADKFNGAVLGLYANALVGGTIYIDDVTIGEYQTGTYGAVRLDGNNDLDYTYYIAKLGTSFNLPVPQCPTLEMAFKGWFTDTEMTVPLSADTIVSAENTMTGSGSAVQMKTLYADYANNSITINTNYGGVTESFVLKYSFLNGVLSDCTKPADPVIAGRYFDGWYTTDGFISEVNWLTLHEGDTVYAGFIDDEVTVFTDVNYNKIINTAQSNTVKYNVENGAVVSIQTGYEIEPPERSGYTFTGWYLDEDCTIAASTLRLKNGQTIYAGWQNSSPFISSEIDKSLQSYLNWEEGSDFNWNATWPGSPVRIMKTDDVSITSEMSRTDKYSLKIAGDNQKVMLTESIPENGHAQKFFYKDNRTFDVGFWYYIPEDLPINGKAYLVRSALTFNLEFTYTCGLVIDFNTAPRGVWSYCSATITANTGEDTLSTGALALLVNSNTNYGTVYLDDVVITRVDDLATPEHIGLQKSPSGVQMLNDEAFSLSGGNSQAVRYLYTLSKNSEASVSIRGVEYTISEIGVLINRFLNRMPLHRR